jgi:hypothetical protein
MDAGGFCKTRGAYLATRIHCILVKGVGVAIMTIEEKDKVIS